MRISDWSQTCALPICVTARRAALDSPGRAVACLALALAVLGASPAAGQEGVLPGEVAHTAPGMVTAQTFDAPGQAFSVAVSPYDDSDLTLKLQADFEAALAEQIGRASFRERVCTYG